MRNSTHVINFFEYAGKAGRVEITVGGNKRHSMRLQLHEGNDRIARAIFKSPSFGLYDFRMDQDVKKGIIVLTTTNGIHKLSYKLEDEDPKLVMEVCKSFYYYYYYYYY